MSNSNKIFGAFDVKNSSVVYSVARRTHENLPSSAMLDNFNVYRTWGSTELSLDIQQLGPKDFIVENNSQLKAALQKEASNSSNPGADMAKEQLSHIENVDLHVLKPVEERKFEGNTPTGVRALFNKFHAIGLENDTYSIRLSQNLPLIDSPSQRRFQRTLTSCTVYDLVQKSKAGLLGAAVYDYSDFMFCKYLGRVPNNYMITLRRFNIPIGDYIKPYGNPSAIEGHEGDAYTETVDNKSETYRPHVTTKTDNGGVPMGCLVTWLNTPGNEMSEILKYSFKMPYKEAKSKWEDDGAASQPVVNRQSHGLIGKAFAKGHQNDAWKATINFLHPNVHNPRGGQTTSYPGPHYDAQKAYTGIDMIKSIYIRDPDAGLQFDHKFKLTFDYELKSYDGVNGKQAMLDLLGNILTVCYTTGDFWPGGYRHTAGSSSMQPMSSLECMQHHKTFSGYVKAFQHDFARIKGRVSQAMQGGIEGMIDFVLQMLDNIGGQMLGGDPESAPPSIGQGTNALLSDAAVGLWHVTVGNPCAPILSMGNMILTNCTVEHYGPLGLDDFPTGIRVTCELTQGKPRDKRLIERMYHVGNDRIYMPLDQDIANLIRNSDKKNQKTGVGGGGTKLAVSASQVQARNTEAAQITRDQLFKTVASPVPELNMTPIEETHQYSKLQELFGALAGKTLSFGVVNTAGEMNEGAPAYSDNSRYLDAVIKGEPSNKIDEILSSIESEAAENKRNADYINQEIATRADSTIKASDK